MINLHISRVFKRYLFWWLLGLSVLIPLYPKFPLFNVPGTYVAVRMEDLLIAFVTVWWFISILPDIKKFLSQTLTQSMLLFWIIGGLSLFSGIFLTQTVAPHLGLLHWLRRIEVMILLFVSISAFATAKQVKIWLFTMFVVTFFVIMYGFGQQWLGFPVISTTNKEFSKGLILTLSSQASVNSTFAGHYDLAAYLSVFIVMTVLMIFYVKILTLRVIIVVVSFFGFVLLSLTAARVSFLSTILGIYTALMLLGQKKLLIVLLGLAVFAFAISEELRHRTIATLTVNILGGGGEKYMSTTLTPSFSVAPGDPVDTVIGESLNTTERGVYRSLGIRLNEEWPRAARAFLKNPFLGTGYSSITIATDNDYMRSLGETGVLGTISLGLVFLLIIKIFLKSLKRVNDITYYLNLGLLCSLLVLAVTAVFIDVLESSKIAQLLWISLGVGIASINLRSNNES